MSNTVINLQRKPATKTRPAVVEGFRNKKPSTDAAVAYFEAKLAKWTALTDGVPDAKLTVLIPGYAFQVVYPSGFSIYYELEP